MKPHCIGRQASRRDAGFTLPELLITVAILGIIMVGLAAAFGASVRHNQATSDRLGQSHDAQIVANYIVQDAQGAPATGVATGDTSTCGAAGTAIVRLRWTTTQNTSVGGVFNTTTNNVNYVVNNGVVTRWSCTGVASPWGRPTSSTVGRNITSASATCTGGSATCGAASTATGLKVLVTETQGAAQPFNFTVNAAFRPSIGTKPTGKVLSASDLSLLVLGNGGSPCVNLGGNAHLNLASATEAAGVNCDGYFKKGLQTGDFYSPGACTSNNCGSLWHTGYPAIPDPYASRTYPSIGPGAAPSTCLGGALHGGTYTTVTISGNCVFDGTIVITGVLTLNNNAVVTSAASGVLVYLSGPGNVLSLGNGNTSITLRPAISSSTWPEFSMIFPRTASTIDSNTASMVLAGIYAPNSTFIGNGNSQRTFGKFVVGGIGSSTGTPTYTIG